jgi:maltose O-acetyltransferase
MNLYRGGFSNLTLGDECFVGDDVLIDLAGPIGIGRQVTISTRAMLLSHLNVGYADHPLQARFPPQSFGISIGEGSFLGAGTIVVDGIRIGSKVFVAAGAVVATDITANAVVGGVPAKPLSGSVEFR